MRQHAIPQNVLDVEFKLFTKFTLREFAYLAIGVSIGGIFLYFTSKGQLPGVIGIPIFVIFAGLGAFFALVPINDQPADKFISNYFGAINRPTQRVWLNTQLKDQRVKPTIQTESKKNNIIGLAGLDKIKKQIFKETPDDIFTQESTKKVSQEVKKEENQTVKVNSNPAIVISEENINKYQFSIKSVDRLPGNINLWLVKDSNTPIPNVNTYLKSKEGKLLYANKTDKNGYFITNKMYPDGIYDIEFEGLESNLPSLRIVLTKNMGKLPYKITLK